MNATELFRTALRREREHQGINRSQLASRMGVSRQRVVALEGGSKSPTLTTVQAAADALRLTPDVFFRDDSWADAEALENGTCES